MRSTYLEVNLDAIAYNLKQIQEKVGKGITVMPVIKADGYGTGAASLKQILEENKIKIAAVAICEEGIALRKAGFSMDIMVLNQIPQGEVKNAVTNNLTIGVANQAIAELLNKEAEKQNKIVKIHLEIDTGMGRTGLFPEKAVEVATQIQKLEHIQIQGIYTHFSSGDTDKEYTKKQIKLFSQTLENLENAGFSFEFVHASASTGITHFPEAKFNLVRPGIILFGHYPDKLSEKEINLKPCTKLISQITFLKEVPKGTAISYGRRFITKRAKTKIATVAIGYGDGYPRSLSGKGYVKIRGKLAPIVGTICMDSFMVDVTKLPEVEVGDKVYLWDNEDITVEKVAQEAKTITHEILCNINQRVPRKYVKEEKE